MRGSSPLARGTRQDPQVYHQRGRLIPARAGNTHENRQCLGSSSAHPRSRGEHSLIDDDFAAYALSAAHPRSRGEHPGR